MKDALDSMSELFIQYGGHSQAAGLSLKTELIPEFRERFDKYVREHLSDEDFRPVIKIDAILSPEELTVKTAEELEKLEPHGIGNPNPVLACKNISGANAVAIGSAGTHLKFDVKQGNGATVPVFVWDKAIFAEMINAGEKIDLAYRPATDFWQEKIIRWNS